MKKSKSRIPYGIVIVGLMLVMTSFVHSATIFSDEGISDDSFGTMMSFDGDWLSLANASFTSNISIAGTTIDSTKISAWDAGGAGADGYFLNGTIQNSNGNSWTATGANIQQAIWDLNSTGGTVWIPSGNISLSSSLKIPSNVELCGVGNASILWLNSNSNCSVITNYDTTNGNKDIYIHNLRIEGNGLNQPEWSAGFTPAHECNHGIFLDKVDNFKLERLTINNTHSSGIYTRDGLYGKSIDNYITNAGKLYKDSGNDYPNYWAKGIMHDNVSHSIISDNIVNNTYASGIAFENIDETNPEWYSHDVIVSDNLVSDSNYGIYAELCFNCVVDGNIVRDCTNDAVYGSAAGFFEDATCFNNHFSDNLAYNCGEGGGSGMNYILSGDNTTVDHCHSVDSNNVGFVLYGSGQRLIGCTSNGDTGYGILLEAGNYTVQNCEVRGSGNDAIYTSDDVSGNHWGKIEGCLVEGSGDEGIESFDYNVSIIGNTIRGGTGSGIEINGDHSTVLNNNVLMVGSHCIRIINSLYGKCDHNYVYGSAGDYGYGIQASSSNNWTFIGNTIIQSDSLSPYIGIKETGTSDYNKVLLNDLIGSFNEYVTVSGSNTRVNCTGYDDWNFYNGVS